MGRPSKLTPQLQESICKTLSAGVDVETACLREGVGHSTIREWIRRGQKGEQPFEDFLCATAQAMANVETHVTANILKTSARSWQAGAWWLKWRATRGAHKVDVTVQPAAGQVPGAAPQLSIEAADAIRSQVLFAGRPKQLADGRTQAYADAGVPDDTDEGDADDFGTEPCEPEGP